MAKKSKKIARCIKKIDSSKVYPVAEAVALAKEKQTLQNLMQQLKLHTV